MSNDNFVSNIIVGTIVLGFVGGVIAAIVGDISRQEKLETERQKAKEDYERSVESCTATGKPLYVCEKEIKKFKFGIDLDVNFFKKKE